MVQLITKYYKHATTINRMTFITLGIKCSMISQEVSINNCTVSNSKVISDGCKRKKTFEM